MTKQDMSRSYAEREISRLRNEAYYAYLDGRTKRAKKLNREADRLASPWRAEKMPEAMRASREAN
jgi:hypothetical protein